MMVLLKFLAKLFKGVFTGTGIAVIMEKLFKSAFHIDNLSLIQTAIICSFSIVILIAIYIYDLLDDNTTS